jgi:hypothetical protein
MAMARQQSSLRASYPKDLSDKTASRIFRIRRPQESLRGRLTDLGVATAHFVHLDHHHQRRLFKGIYTAILPELNILTKS